jgi:murein DD-endopeptidase MepM/ murein hydrolase activator NlpD
VPVASAGLASATPLLPDDRLGIARLERRFDALEQSIAWLGGIAAEQVVARMAFPYRLPVAGQRISSSYGLRHDPFTGRLARHTGLDIPAAHGTPILASGGGRVVAAGMRGAYGRAVVIDHGGGLATLYGHASKLLVRPGDVVMPNQPIALVGSTGRSTGPHLHFEVLRNGARVEPSQYLGRVLAPSELVP